VAPGENPNAGGRGSFIGTLLSPMTWNPDRGPELHDVTPDQMSLLRGRRYNRAKKGRGNPTGLMGQNDPLPTASRLAKEHGVSLRRRLGRGKGLIKTR
jgi:hypothetical protein